MIAQLKINKDTLTPNNSLAKTDEIPIIDIGAMLAGEKNSINLVAEQINQACKEIGFFFIVNHNMDQSIIDRAFDKSKIFFNLPMSEKMKVLMNKHQCGYMPPNVSVHNDTFETRKTATRPQISEAFKFTTDLDPSDPDFGKNRRFRGHNKWPDPRIAPGLHEDFMEFHKTFEKLALKLLKPLSVSLQMPDHYFDSYFERSSSMTRIAFYPAVDKNIDKVTLPGHRDISFLSLIPPATRPGLEILTQDGNWIKQPVLPEAILVNTGNTLVRWINDEYIATPHRVCADSTECRYSNIFFLYPNIDTIIQCIPSCQKQDSSSRYSPIKFQDFHSEYAARNFGYAENWD
tara:strand:+ start:1332 stop:2369 length:1038 start_codon:yes stop_codon:yes gene_type:complete